MDETDETRQSANGKDGRKVKAFERLDREGRIDLTSGAWDHASNVRAAHCGRCGLPVASGAGKPFNTFMRDFYRATTGYLCPSCAAGSGSGVPSQFGREQP